MAVSTMKIRLVRAAVAAMVASVLFSLVFTPSALAMASAGAPETTPEAPAEAGGAGGHDKHDTSVPMGWQQDLALFSLITFLLFLFVMKKFAWQPLIDGLDKRESGIRQAIADAEDNRRKSHALLAEYEQKLKHAEQTVQQMVAEARRDAERTSQDLIAGAQKEVQLIRDRAKDDIRQAKDTALAEVFSSVNAQVIRATEHVLGRSLGDGDQDRFVEEALAGIGR
jgi:F-type H+-transporting ATPase subunit b